MTVAGLSYEHYDAHAARNEVRDTFAQLFEATHDQTDRLHSMATQFGFDLADLWPRDHDYDPATWLDEHAWTVTVPPAPPPNTTAGRRTPCHHR